MMAEEKQRIWTRWKMVEDPCTCRHHSYYRVLVRNDWLCNMCGKLDRKLTKKRR